MVIVWRKLALLQVHKIYNYIKKDSLQSAKKVREKTFKRAEELKHNPTIYPLDKYRKNNNGSFRAFEVYNYRIAYQITKSEVRILRVRHTSREPKELK